METDNYYDEILLKIKNLIQDDENKKAIELLKIELEMPYIPQKYEIEFQNLYEKLFLDFAKKIEKHGQMTKEEIITYLNSNNPIEESMAIDQLNNINARLIVDELKKWIEKNGDDKHVGKAFILETLIDQKVDINITINNIIINPSKDKSVLEAVEVLKGFKYVEELVDKEPQLKDIVYSEFKRYLLLTYPIIPTNGKNLVKDIYIIVKSMIKGKMQFEGKLLEIFNKLNE